MKIDIVPNVNTVTTSYIAALRELKNQLLEQVKRIDNQIAVSTDFADLETKPASSDDGEKEGDPEPHKSGASDEDTASAKVAQEYKDPRFLQDWKERAASTAAGTQPAKTAASPAPGKRPVISHVDEQRLAHAIAAG